MNSRWVGKLDNRKFLNLGCRRWIWNGEAPDRCLPPPRAAVGRRRREATGMRERRLYKRVEEGVGRVVNSVLSENI